METTSENHVDWYGLDKDKYDNSNSISSVKVGDKVIVFDLSNYKSDTPELPCEAIVTAVYEYEIDVKIKDKTYEIYTSQFGYRKYFHKLLNKWLRYDPHIQKENYLKYESNLQAQLSFLI